MNQQLADAILQKRRLRFTYHGKMRLAEPQCYGIGTHGNELLRVHQLEGGVQREPLFTVSKIEGLVVLEESFVEPGPNDKKGTRRWGRSSVSFEVPALAFSQSSFALLSPATCSISTATGDT